MTYSIPVNKIEKLQKIFARYQKRGANLTLNIGEEVIEDGTLYVEDKINHCMKSFPIKVTCKEVFVDGSYVINNWHFVGTIEFTENGNIIRLADSSFEGKVPAKYLHTEKICEHCGKIRNRKDTYLIYNDETNEFKQVGSTCLLDYTKGLDANMCADMMSCLNKIASLGNFDCDADSFLGNGFDSTYYGFDRKYVLPFVIAYVTKYGYQKMCDGKGTVVDVWTCFNGNFGPGDEYLKARVKSLKNASEEELNAIDEYAKSHMNEEYGYMRNASLAWLKTSIEYRDFGLISSFVNTYLKEVNKSKELLDKTTSQYQGNVGDRITIKINKVKALYSKPAYNYYDDGATVYELIDNNGNVYIWSTTDCLSMYFDNMCSWTDDNDIRHSFMDESGNITLKATVKAHKEYKDIKQTVITRGKVLCEGISYTKDTNRHNTARQDAYSTTDKFLQDILEQ